MTRKLPAMFQNNWQTLHLIQDGLLAPSAPKQLVIQLHNYLNHKNIKSSFKPDAFIININILWKH